MFFLYRILTKIFDLIESLILTFKYETSWTVYNHDLQKIQKRVVKTSTG